jgi:hypothetical protein
MALMLEVKVPCGLGDGNREPKATESLRGGVGRRPKVKFGADEQRSDKRPACKSALRGIDDRHEVRVERALGGIGQGMVASVGAVRRPTKP